MSTSDSYQNNLRRNPCLINVNMTSKQAFHQEVTVLLNSTAKKEVLLELNHSFWYFSVTTITMENANSRRGRMILMSGSYIFFDVIKQIKCQ